MASLLACSLHPMDVRLLKQCVAAFQGGAIPDFTVEVTRRAHRDLLLNWSLKVSRAAASLASQVPPDRWRLYTRLRPFFITADTPEQAAYQAERFFTVASQDEIVNLYREEVARIDADQADAVIDRAVRDAAPNVLLPASPDESAGYLRAYLLYQRRQLETLAAGNATDDQLARAGRLLAWRTCMLLANLHPSWQTGATSLTGLASRTELGLAPLVADPRGMYAAIARRLPGLHERIPYHLSRDCQTGLCISPASVPAVLSEMEIWPTPIPAQEGAPAVSAMEVMALQEALLYARRQKAGLWEAAGLVNPDANRYPQILADQGEADERLEIAAVPAAAAPTAVAAVADSGSEAPAPAAAPESIEAEYDRMLERTRLPDQAPPPAARDASPAPWYKKVFRKK